MEHYVGLDVSLKSTAICIVDAKGKIVREGAVITDPETIRGLFEEFRPYHRRAKLNTFTVRAGDLLEGRPELAIAVEPLLKAREAVGRQIVDLDGKVRRLTRASVPVRRLMTAPGIGPITALCYLAIIHDPNRFGDRAMSVPILARYRGNL